jgi:serpin B
MRGDRKRAPVLAVAAAVLLTACGSGGATPLVLRGDVIAAPAGTLAATDVARAQTAFGVDLLHAVCGASPEEDVLLSPTSAAEALGLLYPAAAGTTARSMGAVLHLPAWSPDLVAAFRDHTRALAGLRYDGDLDDEDAPDSLRLSNHLWTARGVQPQRAYLDDLATAFDADLRVLDFAGDPSGATDRINSTVAEDTAGVIDELFDEPLAPGTRAVLTNAVHLKARWATPFTSTDPAPFAAPPRLSITSLATYPAIFGFSLSRLDEYAYQSSPNGTYTLTLCPAPTSIRRSSSSTPRSIWNS